MRGRNHGSRLADMYDASVHEIYANDSFLLILFWERTFHFARSGSKLAFKELRIVRILRVKKSSAIPALP
jgi:hypothetical protein